jgi:hypothetical protein
VRASAILFDSLFHHRLILQLTCFHVCFTAGPIPGQSRADPGAFACTAPGAAWDAAAALQWTQAELVAFLRAAPPPLGPAVAALFEAEVVDGKTLALMEPTDLSALPPEGFGLDPRGATFAELWRLAQALRAALHASDA